MDLTRKGWLAEYLEKWSTRRLDKNRLRSNLKGMHPDQSLYAIVQPTGIMYGFPVGQNQTSDDLEASIGLLLLDSLLSTYVLVSEAKGYSFISIQEAQEMGITEIAKFYNTVYSELYTSPVSFFGKKKGESQVVETILNKRLNLIKEEGNFWSGFFNNSLLFLDIYFFRQWVQTEADDLIATFLKSQKDIVRLDVVKVMAAAAHSNHSIEAEERELFEHFVNSLSFPPDRKKEAVEYFEHGVSIEDIPLPGEDTWILKKYLFELAILTTWADRRIEESEEMFLKEYNLRLGFSEAEYLKSFVAVEGFVLEYWEELKKLQDKSDFETISVEYVHRMKEVIISNKDIILKEIQKRDSLLRRLQNAKIKDISDYEKDSIQKELLECIQSIPIFEVISLPKKFLTLKVLMDILPTDFFGELNH